MTPNELARLRAVAEAATPGPWQTSYLEEGIAEIETVSGAHVVYADGDPNDAAHAATFDPPTVLALLAEVERLQAGREVEREMLRNALPGLAERNDLAAKVASIWALADEFERRGDRVVSGVIRETIRAATSSELPATSKFGVDGPTPTGGLDLTDEEFAAFLKAAKS